MRLSSVRQVRIAFLVLALFGGLVPASAQFDPYDVPLCRMYDSRGPGGPRDMWDPLDSIPQGAATYTIPIAGVVVPACGAAPAVPADATAVVLSLTMVGVSKDGYLQVFPAGTTPSPRPLSPLPPIPVGAVSFAQEQAG